MRLRVEDLPRRLAQGLDLVYLLSGDEPQQLLEAAEAIRTRLREQGFGERELFDQSTGFQWNELKEAASSLSLFSQRRLLEVRLTSASIGNEGSRALVDYANHPSPEDVLLILCPRLDSKQTQTAWVKAIDTLGLLIQIWPLTGETLTRWLEQRLRRRGLQPDAEVAAALGDLTQGNLLAAAQEIDKLALLLGGGRLDLVTLETSVADNARYDVFSLVDAALAGEAKHLPRMLANLRREGAAEPVVLWALAREIRKLARIAWAQSRGESLEKLLSAHKVFSIRQGITRQALRRHGLAEWRRLLRDCARLDRAIKGLEPTLEPWRGLLDLSLRLAGTPAMPRVRDLPLNSSLSH